MSIIVIEIYFYVKVVDKMCEFNQFQDRTDKLALAYMKETCDISKMSVEEYLKKFNEISEKILEVYANGTSK